MLDNNVFYKGYLLLKDELGVDFLIQNLNLHHGTIKRWEKLKQIPSKYIVDFQNISEKLNLYKLQNYFDLQKYDEFYTTFKTATYCFELLKRELAKINVNIREYNFIEPSAGIGQFYNIMPLNKRIGVEINPTLNSNYIISNYLNFIPKNNKKYIVFGNPPFGPRGNLVLRFINHSYKFADIVAFILPPLFNSDGKGTPKNRVLGYKLVFSQNLPLESFEYPNGKKVSVSTIFQIWSKINTHLIPVQESKNTDSFIKIYSLSDGGTPSSIRNKKMIDKCDFYLPSACFKGMKIYKTFQELPNRRSYGVVVLKNFNEICKVLLNVNWNKVAFLSTNSALNLRMSLIKQVLIKDGYYDKV